MRNDENVFGTDTRTQFNEPQSTDPIVGCDTNGAGKRRGATEAHEREMLFSRVSSRFSILDSRLGARTHRTRSGKNKYEEKLVISVAADDSI